MSAGPFDSDDITALQRQADRLLAQARSALQAGPGFFAAHAADAGRTLQQLREQRSQALQADLAQRLAAADRPAPGTPLIEPDAATVFARRVRRRRHPV